MAYDYQKTKQLYEWLNDQQKQQFAEMNKNDTSWNYQRFMDDYNKEINSQTNNTPQSNTNSSNFNNGNGTNWQNIANNQTPTIQKTENQNVSPDLDQSKFWEAPEKVDRKSVV